MSMRAVKYYRTDAWCLVVASNSDVMFRLLESYAEFNSDLACTQMNLVNM